MPKNSRRIAAKQAELSQRKRKAHKQPPHAGSHSTQGQQGAAQSGPAMPRAALPEASSPEASQDAKETNTSAVARPAPQVAPQDAPARRVQRSAPTLSANTGAVNPYIWPEIRHIGALSGVVFVMLAVLTVFLR